MAFHVNAGREVAMKTPNSSSEFERSVGILQKDGIQALSTYVMAIPPSKLKSLFKDSLSAKCLEAFVAVAEHLHGERPKVRYYLLNRISCWRPGLA